MKKFIPNLDILPDPQQRLWKELVDTPHSFTLYGGTGIALQLGHRESLDFDFFGREPFDPDHLIETIPYLSAAATVQKAADTLTVRIDRGAPVLVSFFGTPTLGAINPPLIADDIGLQVASLIDLAALKTVAVQKRAEAKDFIDLDALITAGVTLSNALAGAQIIQGPTFNPQISLKALSYYEDGNLSTLDASVKHRLKEAVRAVELQALPSLKFERAHKAGGRQ